MQILINQSLRRSEQEDGYKIISPDIHRIVLHRHYMIMVVAMVDSGMALNVVYKKQNYYAVLKGMTADQAAALAKPFFEAVKSGHDSFEVANA